MTVLQVKVEKYILLQLLFFIRGFGEHLSFDLSLHATKITKDGAQFLSHTVGSTNQEVFKDMSACKVKLFPASPLFPSYHFGEVCDDAPHLYSIIYHRLNLVDDFRLIIDLSAVFNFRKYLTTNRVINCVLKTLKESSTKAVDVFYYTGVVCSTLGQCSVWSTEYKMRSSDSEAHTLRPKLIYSSRSVVFYAAYVSFPGWGEGTLIFKEDQTVFLTNNAVEFYDPLGIKEFTNNVFVGVEAAEQNVLAIGFDDVEVFTYKTITRKQQKLNTKKPLKLGSLFDREKTPVIVFKRTEPNTFEYSKQSENTMEYLVFPDTVVNAVAFNGGFAILSGKGTYYHMYKYSSQTKFVIGPQFQISSDFFKIRFSTGSIIINDSVQPLYKPWSRFGEPVLAPTVSAAGKSIVIKFRNGVYEFYDGKLNFYNSTDTTAPVIVDGSYLQMVLIAAGSNGGHFELRQFDPTSSSLMQPLKTVVLSFPSVLQPTLFAVKELAMGGKVFAIVNCEKTILIGYESKSGSQKLHERRLSVFFEDKLIPIDRYLAIHFIEHKVTERLAPLYIVCSSLTQTSLFLIEVSFPLDPDEILKAVVASAVYRIFEKCTPETISSIFFIRGEREINGKNSASPRSHAIPVMAGALLSYTVDTAPLHTTIPQTTTTTTKPSKNNSKNTVHKIVAAVVVAIHLALISIVLFIF